jgi:hypothetical protein
MCGVAVRTDQALPKIIDALSQTVADLKQIFDFMAKAQPSTSSGTASPLSDEDINRIVLAVTPAVVASLANHLTDHAGAQVDANQPNKAVADALTRISALSPQPNYAGAPVLPPAPPEPSLAEQTAPLAWTPTPPPAPN